MTKEREFKIDVLLAADVTMFLESLFEYVDAGLLEEDEPVTDTFLDQFMPNGFVPNADLIKALLASGIIKQAD
jgi:hypothetical protein